MTVVASARAPASSSAVTVTSVGPPSSVTETGMTESVASVDSLSSSVRDSVAYCTVSSSFSDDPAIASASDPSAMRSFRGVIVSWCVLVLDPAGMIMMKSDKTW